MTFEDTTSQAINETESKKNIQAATDAIRSAFAEKSGTEKTNSNLKDEGAFTVVKIDRFKNDTILKRRLTYFVMGFTAVWSAIINGMVIYNMNKFNAPLSDAILIALMTETLAIVIGLPTIVIWHFFPKQQQNENDFQSS